MDRATMSDTTEFATTGPREAMSASSRTARVRIDLAARTHPGKVRPNNEDNFHVVRFGRHLHTVASSLPPALAPDDFDQGAFSDGMAEVQSTEPLRLAHVLREFGD